MYSLYFLSLVLAERARFSLAYQTGLAYGVCCRWWIMATNYDVYNGVIPLVSGKEQEFRFSLRASLTRGEKVKVGVAYSRKVLTKYPCYSSANDLARIYEIN